MKKDSDELLLKEGEQKLSSAKISRASVVVLWLSVPCFLAVGLWGIVPGIVRLLRLSSYLGEGSTSFLRGLFLFFVIVLALAWAAVAAVLTKKNICYRLTITNLRVVASSSRSQFEAEISELKNVFLENSLLGTIFHYGALTIQAARNSITVKNIRDPESLRKQLLSLMEEQQQ